MSGPVSEGLPERDPLADRTYEAGFVMLGLAQVVCIFALWLALWPEAFGLRRGSVLGTGVGVGFAAAGAVGFYLAFQHLSSPA